MSKEGGGCTRAPWSEALPGVFRPMAPLHHPLLSVPVLPNRDAYLIAEQPQQVTLSRRARLPGNEVECAFLGPFHHSYSGTYAFVIALTLLNYPASSRILDTTLPLEVTALTYFISQTGRLVSASVGFKGTWIDQRLVALLRYRSQCRLGSTARSNADPGP